MVPRGGLVYGTGSELAVGSWCRAQAPAENPAGAVENMRRLGLDQTQGPRPVTPLSKGCPLVDFSGSSWRARPRVIACTLWIVSATAIF